MKCSRPRLRGRISFMRRFKVAFATVVASFAIACGQGTTEMAAGSETSGRSTIGMFLSRSASLSHKDGEDLGKACAADVKKTCGSVQGGDGYVRRLTYCLREHE